MRALLDWLLTPKHSTTGRAFRVATVAVTSAWRPNWNARHGTGFRGMCSSYSCRSFDWHATTRRWEDSIDRGRTRNDAQRPDATSSIMRQWPHRLIRPGPDVDELTATIWKPCCQVWRAKFVGESSMSSASSLRIARPDWTTYTE